MIRLVIIIASVVLSDRIVSASDFLTCHCLNTNCFSNSTCRVPLSNGACFVETSREKGSPLIFGCCINDRILSDCKLYLRRYCESGDYCNRDLQPVSITSGTEDPGSSTTAPTLPPLTLPTKPSSNNATNSTPQIPQSTTNEQTTDENNNGTGQQDKLYLSLFLLGFIVLLLMIVFVSILIIILKCKIKELESRKNTINEAII